MAKNISLPWGVDGPDRGPLEDTWLQEQAGLGAGRNKTYAPLTRGLLQKVLRWQCKARVTVALHVPAHTCRSSSLSPLPFSAEGAR